MAKLAILGGEPTRKEGPLTWPVFSEREKELLDEVLQSRNWGGFPEPNRFAKKFAEKFAAHQDAKYGICAANGTVTLEIALKAGGIKAGDEVIVPAISWIATAQAPITVNAVPVFVDIDPDTYCIDPEAIEAAITSRTKAIIPVHLGYQISNMDAIMQIADKHGLLVVEDCAHAHGGKWNNKGVGSIGHFGSFSFQSSKIMTAGEGGIVLTNNDEWMQKCHSYVNCGRKETGYNEYEGQVFGWNYRITEWQAAVLLAQLERLDEQTKKKKENLDYFASLLKQIDGIELLKTDPRVTVQPIYEVILKYNKEAWEKIHRDRFVEALNAEGFDADPYFYVPMYQNMLFRPSIDEFPVLKERYDDGIGPASANCPVAERMAYEEAVWIHHSYFLYERSVVEQLFEAISKIWENIDELAEHAGSGGFIKVGERVKRRRPKAE